MKRLLIVLFVMIFLLLTLSGGVAIGLYWDRINPFGESLAVKEAFTQWRGQLQQACATEEKLQGVALRSESTAAQEEAPGKLTLTGLVAKPEQIPLVEAKAKALLEQTPKLAEKYPGGIATTGLQVFPVQEQLPRLQADFRADKDDAPEKQHLLSGTRLDRVQVRDDGKLLFQGVCMRGEMSHEQATEWLREAITSRLVAFGAKSETLPDVRMEMQWYDPPSVSLQKIVAADPRLQGAYILADWYERDGKLHLEGLLAKESQRKPAEAAVATWLQSAEAKPIWHTPGTPKFEVKLVTFDADALLRKLQAELGNPAQKEKHWQRVRLAKIVPAYVPDDGKEPARFRLLVTGRYLETGGESARLLSELPGWLQARLPKVAGADRRPMVPKVELTARGDPVEAMQRACVQRGLDGMVVTDARYDTEGRFEVQGRLAEPGAKGKEAFAAAVHEILAGEMPWTLDQLKPHEARENGAALAWSDVMRTCQARLAKSAGAGERSRLDRLYFRYEEHKLRLDGAGVFLADAPKEPGADLNAVLDAVITSCSGATVMPALFKQVPSPLSDWQQKIAEQTTLDGALVTQLHYDADGTLQVKGYLGSPEQRPALHQLLSAQLAQLSTILKPDVKPEQAWSMTAFAPHQSLQAKEQTWTEIRRTFQAELAGSDLSAFRHLRLDRVSFAYRDTPRQLRLQWQGTRLLGLQDQANDPALQKLVELGKKVLPTLPLASVEAQVQTIAAPIEALQAAAVANHLDGVLFEDFVYNADGKLQGVGLRGSAEQSKLLLPLVVPILEAQHKAILSTGMEPLDRLTLVPWPPLFDAMRTYFAASASPLLQQTRLDRAFFQYDPDTKKPRLWLKGLCIFQGKSVPAAVQPEQWAKALKEVLRPKELDRFELAFEDLKHAKNPALELQRKVIAAGMDGVVFRVAGFDAKGTLRIHALTPKGQEENVRKLLEEAGKDSPELLPLEKISALSPRAEVQWTLLRAPDQETPIDWQQMLADLRTRFAGAAEPILQQTRIDRAYFSLNEDDPDQPPFLNFQGVCLRTVHDDPKEIKALLQQALSKVVIPGVNSVLKLDGIMIHDSPIYALQSEAVARRQNDPALNILFERARYHADGHLLLHVLALQNVPTANIAKLYEDDRLLPADLWKLPGGQKKTPTIVRRDFDWPAALKSLRAQFAQSLDPLLQRSRFDDAYFAYSADRKALHFQVQGVCIHPPALVADTARHKKWQSFVSTLIPKVTYEPLTNGMAMLTNPSIVWQDQAAAQESHDGVFFQLTRFDAEGKLKLAILLPAQPQRAAAERIMAEKPVPPLLAPADAQTVDFSMWNWQEVKPKAQARLAEGDFLAHRTRIDRVFLQYEPQRGDAYLHFDGVSLHPTEVEAAELLRAKLERSFKDLLPLALQHRLTAQRIRFLPSPIYALQTEAVAARLDGLLFADGRYDAQGKLHLTIVLGAPQQNEAVRKLVAALPLPDGVLRPGAAQEPPLLDMTELAWKLILTEMQGWLARNNDTLMRKSRLERGFFSYPPSKVGPDLNLALIGIYAKNETLRTRLQKRFEGYVQLYVTDQLQAGPVAVVPTIEHLDNPALVTQTKISEVPTLDGVRLDDASFDAAGKLILHGIWVGKEQEAPLEKLLHDTLTPAHVGLARGLHFGSLQIFDSPALLHQLRVWVADQPALDEVWLERLYFDGVGKTRVQGFATRPQDKEKVDHQLPRLLPPFESKQLPAIEGAGPDQKSAQRVMNASAPIFVMQEAKEDGPARLDLLPNIADYLRARIPTSTACDGVRIDRCYYDAQGVFHIEGLAERAGQTETLKPFLDGNDVPFDRKRQLGKGWRPGRITVIPLAPMMVVLREAIPSIPEFDGVSLVRTHHDAKNRLVITATAFGDADAKLLEPILQRLLNSHASWRRRTEKGLVVEIKERQPVDVALADRLVLRALALLQVTIGEAKIEPAWPTGNGWWSHAWPFDDRLPRIRPSDADYERCLEYLDAALLHHPQDVLAWYLRGYVLQTKQRTDLTLRDFRRMVTMENADRELRHKRILALELVQGRLRQSAFDLEQEAILEVAGGWTLRTLRERIE